MAGKREGTDVLDDLLDIGDRENDLGDPEVPATTPAPPLESHSEDASAGKRKVPEPIATEPGQTAKKFKVDMDASSSTASATPTLPVAIDDSAMRDSPMTSDSYSVVATSPNVSVVSVTEVLATTSSAVDETGEETQASKATPSPETSQPTQAYSGPDERHASKCSTNTQEVQATNIAETPDMSASTAITPMNSLTSEFTEATDTTSPTDCGEVMPCWALGAQDQQFTIGALYNISTNEIQPPKQAAVEAMFETQCRSSTNIYTMENLAGAFKASSLIELQLLCGSVSATGAASSLTSAAAASTSGRHKLALVYEVISSQAKRLETPNHSQNYDTAAMTHIVTSLEYGARVVFLFELEKKVGIKNVEKLAEIVKKIPLVKSFAFDTHAPVRFTLKDKSICSKIRCKVYSDIPIQEVDYADTELGFEDCLKIYHRLPDLIDGHLNRLLNIGLLPLGENNTVPIPPAIVDNLLSMMKKYQDIDVRCKSLLEAEYLKPLPQMRQKFHTFMVMTSLFIDPIRQELSRLLMDMNKPAFSLDSINYFIQRVNSSAFHVDTLQQWVAEQGELLAILDELTDSLKMRRKAKIAPNGETQNILAELKYEFVVVIRLGTMSDEKEQLTKMMDYLREELSLDVKIDDDLESLITYPGSMASLSDKIRDSLSLADDGGKLKIVFTDEPPLEADHGQISLYQRRKLIHKDFIPPPKLDRPQCIGQTHNSLTLSWNPNQQVAVSKFEIAYKKTYFTYWTIKRVGGKISQCCIEYLQPNSLYEVKVRYITPLGTSTYSKSSIMATSPTTPPGKPTVRQVSESGCAIGWSPPSYMPKLRRSQENLWWEVEVSWSDGEIIQSVDGSKYMHQVDLEPDKDYRFRVRSATSNRDQSTKAVEVKGVFGEYSDPFRMSATITISEMIKNRAVVGSTRINDGCPAIYDLNLHEEYSDHVQRLRKLSYGEPHTNAPMKTILVVGATGAGKSTLVNAFVNYVMDVKWEDDFRFRLIQESMNANQARSQTKWVTAYVLYHQESFLVPYSLTIIDTPGFGDTAGIDADRQITNQLSAYFHASGLEGIDSLDAIGFVVQSALPRLTPTQRYIFDSILALFGKDIADNIFMLITFADGQKPPVLQGLKEANLPYTQSFKFNNSAIFAERQTETNSLDSDDEEDESFDKMFWNMGATSYRKFLSHLAKTQSKSLTLTNQVLDERQQLEIHVTGIHQQIREGLSKLEELKAGLRCLSDHHADIDRNKDFEYVVNIQQTVKIDLQRGTYVTNCLTCNRTCHYPCGIPRDEDKAGCWAMDRTNNDSYCRICPTGCHWSVHVNTPYRYELKDVQEKRTASDLKAQYEQASQQKLTTEEVIMKMLDDVDAREVHTAYLTNEVRTSLDRLSKIALKPSHLTTVEYIDVLIQSEKSQALPGWQMRIHQLEAVRERAVTLSRVAQESGVTEPWDKMREAIKEEHDTDRNAMWQSLSSVIDRVKAFVSRRFQSQ